MSLSVRTPKFATLSGLQEANKQLLGNLDERISPMDEKKLTSWAIDYWNRLADLVEPWHDIRDGDMKPQEARQEFISSYALALWALGAAGKAVAGAAKQTSGNRADLLGGLREIDWRKSNPDWQGICMAEHEVVTRMPTRRATALYILWKIGLSKQRPTTVISEERRADAVARQKAPKGRK